jgi:tetratricopeptide (TPR) repeat protein
MSSQLHSQTTGHSETDQCVALSFIPSAAGADSIIEHCSAAIQSGKGSNDEIATAFMTRGNAYQKKLQFDRAIKDYDEVIRRKPGNAVQFAGVFTARGLAYVAKGQIEAALRDFDEAIRLTNRGVQLTPTKENQLARIAASDTAASAYQGRAYAFQIGLQYESAIQDYDMAIRLRPKDAALFVGRGTVYSAKGSLEEAITDFGTAIHLNPNLADAYYDRGLAYLNQGQFDQALQDFDDVIRLTPNYPRASEMREAAKNRMRTAPR